MGTPWAGVTPLDPLQPFTNSSYMAQASIHFEPVKGGSEEHNKRLKFLDYVRPERTRFNEYYESDTQAHRLAIITQNFLEHHPTRKKLHAKATPIREAVVNIEEGTTMDDLKKLAKRLEQRFGITIFQIAIHRDEGFFNSDSNKLNLHAHLVADWTNHKNGESIKLNRQDMAEMQTITAEVLGMERGVSSDKKHLTAMQYKEQKAREEAEKAKLQQLKAESAQRIAEQKRDAAEKAEKEAQKNALKAETRAVSGAIVKGAAALVGKFSEGKKIAAAKEEGRAEALAQVLKGAGMKYNDMSKVTPEKVGRDLAALGKDAKELREENAKLHKSVNDVATWRDALISKLLSIPIILQCAQIIRYFVAHDLRHFERDDIQPLKTALRGDESAASDLVAAAKWGSVYNQPHLSDRWQRAERELQGIARGKSLGEQQAQNQEQGWSRGI